MIQDMFPSLHETQKPTNCALDRPSSTALVSSCVASACEIIDTIHHLYKSDQLAPFVHTDFHSCSSAIMIILLDSIIKPNKGTFSKVAMGMECMQFMALWNPVAKKRLFYVQKVLCASSRALELLRQSFCDTNPSTILTAAPTPAPEHLEGTPNIDFASCERLEVSGSLSSENDIWFTPF